MMEFHNRLLCHTQCSGFTVPPIRGTNLTLVRHSVNSVEGDYLSDVLDSIKRVSLCNAYNLHNVPHSCNCCLSFNHSICSKNIILNYRANKF